MIKLSTNLRNLREKIETTWDRHGDKILIVLAIILVSVVGFNAGKTYQQKTIEPAQISMVVNESGKTEISQAEQIKALGEAMERRGVELAENEKIEATGESSTQEKECAFVGSKNSDKYHLPSCGWATRIKKENRVCFSSEDDAEKQGYVGAGCCIK